MAIVYLSLGTNMGDRWQHLQGAIDALGGVLTIKTVSPVYETAPWGPIRDQPSFLNCCVRGDSPLEPEQLLVALKTLEKRLGGLAVKRWGPRTIDIDVLSVGRSRLVYANWKLPKPQIEQQAFVLVPLRDIAPDWRHPISGCLVGELLRQLDCSKVVYVGELKFSLDRGIC